LRKECYSEDACASWSSRTGVGAATITGAGSVVNISSRAGQWIDGWDVQVLLFLFGSGLAPAPGRARARTSGRQACHVLGSVAARGWSLCACRGSWSWGVVCVARRAPGVTDKTHGFAADMAPTARVRVGARNHSIHALPPVSTMTTTAFSRALRACRLLQPHMLPAAAR
jgi:hypothetical protein